MNEIIQIQEKYARLQTKHFYENVIFSFQWWFLLTLTVVIWIIWIVLVDKKRLHNILLIGLLTSLIAFFLDDIGYSMALWNYSYSLVPYTSIQIPIDLAIIPVFYMLLYQYFRKWKSYLIALTLITLFAVFVVEAFFIEIGIYVPLRWELWYAAPIYFLIGIFVKSLIDKIEKRSEEQS